MVVDRGLWNGGVSRGRRGDRGMERLWIGGEAMRGVDYAIFGKLN